jgi:hypothetical protein
MQTWLEREFLLTQTWTWSNLSGNVINPNHKLDLTQMGMWLMDRMNVNTIDKMGT